MRDHGRKKKSTLAEGDQSEGCVRGSSVLVVGELFAKYGFDVEDYDGVEGEGGEGGSAE